MAATRKGVKGSPLKLKLDAREDWQLSHTGVGVGMVTGGEISLVQGEGGQMTGQPV